MCGDYVVGIPKQGRRIIMPCIFNIKQGDRNCRFCTATICDEKQRSITKTFTTNKIE